MIKTYKTSHGNLSTIVNMNGKNVRIRFVSRDNNVGYYTTPNVALQTAIESDRDYGRLFYLYHEAEPITQPELKKVEHIASWQAAREMLRAEPYLVPANRLRSPSSIERAARENGIVFSRLSA